MKLRNITILAILLIGSSCSYLKNVGLLTNGKLARKDFVQAVPFEYKKGLIVVKARVNADSTLREFIFDTGAFNSKIEKGLAESLGMKAVTTKTNSDSNGNKKTIEVTRIDSLILGETTFINIGAGKVEYGEKSASPCIAPHGIIGANLIQLAYWKIDFEQKMLYFSDKPFEADANLGKFLVPFNTPVFSGTPDISINLESEKIEGAMFDLGYNGGLILPAKFADLFLDKPSEIFLDQSTSGIYGTKADSLISKHLKLDLGGYEAVIPVEFSANGKALLGNEILEHFLIFIDFEDEQITLQPVSSVEISPNPAFLPGILNDTLWVVNRSKQGSQLQLGDTLLSINGKKPKDLFTNHCEYFMQISKFIYQDSLQIETLKGDPITLYR
ncbi:retropepsin-like aspartic protease [Cytophagales bacterium LB-30]|uniref:Retropepsin-like aspartic protease n=1 Tax=Shiella aurantiaca TaxID=3058365 RepID=A0ABT8F9M3_9BACT|nr:retropepsin-like aspartic protease [Shiella aurantiaca]MDN4166983.1 retropepsin-like aspartic protease [Shiella aurantiaca]